MAGRQKENDSPDRTVRAKKSIGKISILICIFTAALVINGVFWIVDRNVMIHNAEEALSELKTRSSVQNIELSELITAAYSAGKADGGSDDVFVRSTALKKGTTEQSNKHGIVLENRKKLTLTGVEDVSDFNERKIVASTELGQLTITGHSLHISAFDPKTGELCVRGTIDSLVYSEKKKITARFMDSIRESLSTRLNPVATT